MAKMLPEVRRRRHYLFKMLSHAWAKHLHGKMVTLFWAESEFSVHGMAFEARHAGGGWGQVKVILDYVESPRVVAFTSYGYEHHAVDSPAGLEVYSCPPLSLTQEVLDRLSGRSRYSTFVTWGARRALKIDGS